MMIQSYPWYIAAWRSSETRLGMNSAERGLYRDLLDYTWLEGSLPADEEMLLRIAAITTKEFNACWPKVKSQFFERDGRLRHPKVDERRPQLESWVLSRQKAGKKGGTTRAIAKASAQAIAKLDLKPYTYTHTQDPFIPNSGKAEPDEVIEEIIREHPTRAGVGNARARFTQIILSALEPYSVVKAIIDSHRGWRQSERWTKDNGQYCPSLDKWLDKILESGTPDPPPDGGSSSSPKSIYPVAPTFRPKGIA